MPEKGKDGLLGQIGPKKAREEGSRLSFMIPVAHVLSHT